MGAHVLPFGLMTVLNAAHPLLSGLTGSAETSEDGLVPFSEELGALLDGPGEQEAETDEQGELSEGLADLALGDASSEVAGPGSSGDVPLPDAGLILGGSVPGHFGQAWKANAGDGGANSAGAQGSGVADAAQGTLPAAGEGAADGKLPGASAGDVEVEGSALLKQGAVGDGKSANQAASENAGRRWQSALPPELRAAAGQQQAKAVAAGSQEALAASNNAEEAGQIAGGKAQEAASSAERRIWRSGPGSIFATSEAAASTAGAQGDGAPVISAASSAQPVNTVSAEAVAAASKGSGTPSGAASQVDVAQAGVAAEAGDNSLTLDGEIDTSERRPVTDLRPAVGASANNKAGAQAAGGQANGAQAAAQPTLASAAPQSMSQKADLTAEIMAGDADLPPALENDLAFEPDFAATVRGGEMQGATRTEALQTPNQTQSSHLATQVAVEMARNLKNAQTKFQMRFDPPELGRVDVNMKVSADGSVQAHLIVERPETLDMFLRDQRGLERALEAAGLNTNSNDLQFSLKQQGTDQQLAFGQDQSQQQNNSDQASNGGDGSADDAAGGEIVDSQLVRMALAEQRGGLDIRI